MLNEVWITARGQMIPISEMDTSHITNCIRLIQRKRGWRREFLPRLELELEIRNLEGR